MAAKYKAASKAIQENKPDRLADELATNLDGVIGHWKPLFDAVFLGRVECLELLIHHGVDVNQHPKAGGNHTALTRLCQPHTTIPHRPEHREILAVLLNAGANPIVAGGHNTWLPIAWASMEPNQNFIEQLLAPTRQRLNQHSRARIPLIAGLLLDLDELRALRSHITAAIDEQNRSCLHYVAVSGLWKTRGIDAAVECARFLVDDCALTVDQVHEIPEHDEVFHATPLWYATAQQQNTELVEFLLTRGADPQPAVFAATFANSQSICELLGEYGANWDTTFGGLAPIHELIMYNRTKLIPWLLKHGVDAEVRTPKGQTVLHLAALRGTGIDIVKRLIASGVDPSIEDHAGLRAIDIARDRNRSKLLPVLC